MPGFDRTGPNGQGSRTGWGMGRCKPLPDENSKTNSNDNKQIDPKDNPFFYGRGMGRGMGRGFGRGFGRGPGRGFGRGFRFRGGW